MTRQSHCFRCRDLAATLRFYRALGFKSTHEQHEPYPYGAVHRSGIDLHFSPRLSVLGAKNAFGACLVLVDDPHATHHAFAAGLRSAYGRVPTAATPRITRLRATQTRFSIFDLDGNVVTYILRSEPDADYSSSSADSALLAELEMACFLRDTYANDTAAAKVLDKALARLPTAAPIDRARALAARAELAVALGQTDAARAARDELARLALSKDDRERYDAELRAADDLERWITGES